MGVEVRPAQFSEVSMVLEMQKELAAYCDASDIYAVEPQQIQALVDPANVQSEVFVADVDQKALGGFVTAYVMPLGWRGAPVVYVEDLFCAFRIQKWI